MNAGYVDMLTVLLIKTRDQLLNSSKQHPLLFHVSDHNTLPTPVGKTSWQLLKQKTAVPHCIVQLPAHAAAMPAAGDLKNDRLHAQSISAASDSEKAYCLYL